MDQILGPDDLHHGLPEEYYQLDASSNNYRNSLVWSQEAAIASHRTSRADGRRPRRRVAYRCDAARCILLEVVDTLEGTVLFLPGYKVSRAEATRRGSALRTYIPRAGWLAQLYTFRGSEIGLECRHYMLGVQFNDVFADLRASSPVTRILPGGPPGPTIPVVLYRDRFDGLDQESLDRLADARARWLGSEE
jgi:hypothetical protein